MKHNLKTALASLKRNPNLTVGASAVSVDKPVGNGTWGKLDYLRKVHNYRIRNNSKGFTLIELIIVIAIIAILMAIAMPAYINHRDGARLAAHESNIKILEDAATIFVLQNPGTATIWAPFPGQESNPELEITEKNLHDSWQKYVKEWPACPIGGTYTVEIKADGRITVLPEVEP